MGKRGTILFFLGFLLRGYKRKREDVLFVGFLGLRGDVRGKERRGERMKERDFIIPVLLLY